MQRKSFTSITFYTIYKSLRIANDLYGLLWKKLGVDICRLMLLSTDKANMYYRHLVNKPSSLCIYKNGLAEISLLKEYINKNFG